MRVVILGHTGFLGRALVGAFQQRGFEVQGYASADMDLTQPAQTRRLADVMNDDTLLVLAAAIRRDTADTLETAWRNLAITFNVARQLEAHGAAKCVYVSSAAVYGDHEPPESLPITEKTPVDPDVLYAVAKYAGERLLHKPTEIDLAA